MTTRNVVAFSAVVVLLAMLAGHTVTALPICPAGTYISGPNCLTCSAGTYAPSNSTSCTTCPRAHYSAAGAANCTLCADNTWSQANSSSCTACPAGTTVHWTEATYTSSHCAKTCASGYWSDNSPVTDCPWPVTGSLSPWSYDNANFMCQNLYTLPNPGQEPYDNTFIQHPTLGLQYAILTDGWFAYCSPSAAPNGPFVYTSQLPFVVGTTTKSVSLSVNGTMFDTFWGNGSLASRSVNWTYNGPFGLTTSTLLSTVPLCLRCADGSYYVGGSASSGYTPCAQCAKGTAGYGAISSCTNCVAGTYANQTGQTSCTACAAGTYGTTNNAVTCLSCPAGWVAPAGSTSCAQCGVDTVPAGNLSVCIQCPSNYYAFPGQTSCTRNPATANPPYSYMNGRCSLVRYVKSSPTDPNPHWYGTDDGACGFADGYYYQPETGVGINMTPSWLLNDLSSKFEAAATGYQESIDYYVGMSVNGSAWTHIVASTGDNQYATIMSRDLLGCHNGAFYPYLSPANGPGYSGQFSFYDHVTPPVAITDVNPAFRANNYDCVTYLPFSHGAALQEEGASLQGVGSSDPCYNYSHSAFPIGAEDANVILNRATNYEDPWFSVGPHINSLVTHGENNNVAHTDMLLNHGGAKVYACTFTPSALNVSTTWVNKMVINPYGRGQVNAFHSWVDAPYDFVSGEYAGCTYVSTGCVPQTYTVPSPCTSCTCNVTLCP